MNEHTSNEGNVLIIDDDKAVLTLVSTFLTNAYYGVVAVDSARDIDNLLIEQNFDTVITDINMPSVNGIDVLQTIKKFDSDLPVIMMSGSNDLEDIISSIKFGAYDFIKKPFRMLELLFSVQKAVQKRKLMMEIADYQKNLEIMVIKRTQQLADSNKQLEGHVISSILAMVNALEASDKYTRGHSERVTIISLLIARELGIPLSDLKMLRLGSVMHDIGKIGIDHNILNKPDRLEDYEFDVIKKHPDIGSDILRPIHMSETIQNIVTQHHEKFDGTGYPSGLKGEQISLLARIVSVADTYDAITSKRPYRDAGTKKYALEEITKNIGTQFDETVVKALLNIEKQLTEEKLTAINLMKLLD
ncbi:MAG: response regulator [Candidatus Cloacimonetes bacterium]|nr:response regulator [Candidatus Cloacimonadota bacterium]